MYKQKPLTLSSGIISLTITVLVLLLASSVKAQTGPQMTQEVMRPQEVLPAPAATNADLSTPNTTNQNNLDSLMNQTVVDTDPSTPASNTTNTTSNTNVGQSVRSDLTERRTVLERKRAELASSTISRRAAIAETAQMRIKQSITRLVSVLSEAVLSTKNLSSRLRDYAEDMQVRGLNMTEVYSYLDNADRMLSEADNSLAEINTDIDYALTSPRPLEDWGDARTQLLSARDSLRSARSLLKEALQAIRTAYQQDSLNTLNN